MYHTTKKSGSVTANETTPMDCFIEKSRNWFWIIIILVVGIVVYAVAISSEPPAYSAADQSSPQGGQFQNTALRQCPYCSGFLDARGKCNIRECPIYSPNWGKSVTPNNIPIKRVLIRELALEVGASQGKGSVIVQSVYPGGDAERAGLRVGDRILRFNGRKVKGVKQFQAIVTRAKPQSPVEIKVGRANEKIKTIAMISEGVR